jgi:hypothetical protein
MGEAGAYELSSSLLQHHEPDTALAGYQTPSIRQSHQMPSSVCWRIPLLVGTSIDHGLDQTALNNRYAETKLNSRNDTCKRPGAHQKLS